MMMVPRRMIAKRRLPEMFWPIVLAVLLLVPYFIITTAYERHYVDEMIRAETCAPYGTAVCPERHHHHHHTGGRHA